MYLRVVQFELELRELIFVALNLLKLAWREVIGQLQGDLFLYEVIDLFEDASLD